MRGPYRGAAISGRDAPSVLSRATVACSKGIEGASCRDLRLSAEGEACLSVVGVEGRAGPCVGPALENVYQLSAPIGCDIGIPARADI